MPKKIKIIVIIIGILMLVFSILVSTGVIKIGTDTLNPYVIENPVAKEDINWTFTEKTESDGLNPPRNEVTLQIKDKTYTAGIYEGSCSVTNTELLINQISSATCWWAGDGVELGVFIQDKKLVLKRKPIDEGSAEYPSFVSKFETFLELN
ncbi:MAG: hypothetical protein UU24_C0014G0002 [Candidatus Nomurabacteria bacterium GW2011_GWA2_40_9]|uniref:Uncharacterized protein n=1 Tax=Candidatus Nomurabacteria bacterium GW2011_GWA2_40_9 TaxID=1618734 RepID=A0A0G0W4S0_9BACT|nr:MAG: hypothetical protein UU24_C0014G0002 [Candidatus Nomurabacteria bacterium GW2011_GWA2_40_9]